MKYAFTLKKDIPEFTQLVPVELKVDGGDFNIVATLPSGREVKIIGLRVGSGGRLHTIRWGYGTEKSEVDLIVERDRDGRIRDGFSCG